MKKVLKLFGAVKSGKIDKADFKKWVVRFFGFRFNIELSCTDFTIIFSHVEAMQLNQIKKLNHFR